MAITPEIDPTPEYTPTYIPTYEPPVSPSMDAPIEQMTELDSFGANNAYLKSRGMTSNPWTQQKLNEIHTGVDGITEPQAYRMYQEVKQTKGQPIDLVDVLNKWAGIGEYEKFAPQGFQGEISETTFGDKFRAGLSRRKEIAARYGELALEDGGLAQVAELADFWPSAYRGTKQLIGLEDFDIPVLDKIADVTKGVKLGQLERQEQFLSSLKESGHLKPVVTIKTVRAITRTLTFLNEVKRLGFNYGGGKTVVGKSAKIKTVLAKLGHAQKLSLFSALTAEDLTFGERVDVWKVSSLYMSTPAASGMFKNPALVKGMDLALNSLISNYRSEGYQDIVNSDMDDFDKLVAMGEIFGADVVFSAMTKSFKSEAAPQIKELNAIDKMVRENMRPAPISEMELVRMEAVEAGKGTIEVDRAEAQVKADIQETKTQIDRDLAKIAEDEKLISDVTPVDKSAERKDIAEENIRTRAQDAQNRVDENLDAQKNDLFYGESVTDGGKRFDRVAGSWVDRKTGDIAKDEKVITSLDEKAVKSQDKATAKKERERKKEVEIEIDSQISEDIAILDVLENGGLRHSGTRLVDEFGGLPDMFKNKTNAENSRFILKYSGNAQSKGIPLDEAVLTINARLGQERFDEHSLIQHLSDFDAKITALRQGDTKTESEHYDAQGKEAEGLVLDKSALDIPSVNKAVKEAVSAVIEKNKDRSADVQATALKDIVDQLGEVIDAPRGTHEKTLLNRINNVKNGKPALATTSKEFFKAIDNAKKEAGKTAITETAKSLSEFSRIADDMLDYKTARTVKKKLINLMDKGLSPAKYAEKASEIMDQAFRPKASIERVVGIKDLSKQADITEAELLRSVMKEREKAATGARRATVDKIVASQKVAQNVLDSMPTSVRSKMIAKLKGIAGAKTDEARAKALDKFEKSARDIIEVHEKRDAVTDLNKAIKSANKRLKKGASNSIRSEMEDVISSIGAGKLTEKLDSIIEKATTFDEVEMASIAKEMLSGLEPKPMSEMTAGEVRQYTDVLNGLTHQMNRISKEIKAYGRTKSKQEVVDQKRVISGKKEIARDPSEKSIKTSLRTIGFDIIQIPRSIANNLDYHDPNGQYTKYQKRIEQSYTDEYRVHQDTDKILAPYEKDIHKLGYGKNKDKRDFGGVELGIADRLRIALATRDAGTAEIMFDVGFKRGIGSPTMKITPEQVRLMLEGMSIKEHAIVDAYVSIAKVNGSYMDIRSLSLNGFEMSTPDHTAPRLRMGTASSNKNEADFEIKLDLENGVGLNEAFFKQTVESSGRFKQRTSSKAPLLLYNPVKVIPKTIDAVARYYGHGEVLRDLNKFIYEAKQGGDSSLRDSYARQGKATTFSIFERYVADLNEGGRRAKTESDRFMKKVANAGINYTAGKALKINPKVVFAQSASLPTAGAVMAPKYVQIMNKSFLSNAMSTKEMATKSPYMWARYHGRIGVIAGEKPLTDKQARGFVAMKSMDGRVIGSIWRAMEQKVSDDKPFLKRGADFDRAVESEVIDIMMQSQPTFEAASRPELGRSDDPIARMVMIFSSQRNKNLYLGTKAIGEVLQKQANGTLKPKDVKNAGHILKQLAIANAVFAGITTGFQQAVEELLDARGAVDKDYPNETFGEAVADVSLDFVKNYVTAGLSSSGAWISMLASVAQGFDADRSPLSTIYNDSKKISSLRTDFAEIAEANENGEIDYLTEEQWLKYGSHLTTGMNLVIQPVTGVNIANAYKYFAEAPMAVMSHGERSEEWKAENPNYYYDK